MRVTSFLGSIGDAQYDLRKAVELFIGHVDSRQYVSAGVELGRAQELAARLANLFRLSQEALADEAAWGEKGFGSSDRV